MPNDTPEAEIPQSEFVYDTNSLDSESKKAEDDDDYVKKLPSVVVKPEMKAAPLKKSANMRKAKSSIGHKCKDTAIETKVPVVESNREYERVHSLSPTAPPKEGAEALDEGYIRSKSLSTDSSPHSDTPSPFEFSQYVDESMQNERRGMPALASALEECVEVDGADRGVVEVYFIMHHPHAFN